MGSDLQPPGLAELDRSSVEYARTAMSTVFENLEVLLFGLVGGLAVCLLRDVLPVFVSITVWAEQENQRNVLPHQKALGLASLSWRVMRCWATGRVAVLQSPGGCLRLGSDPATRLLPRSAAFVIAVCLVALVHHLQPAPPSPTLASFAILALLLIALTSFDHRLVADGAVIVVVLTGIGNAVLGAQEVQQQALVGALVGVAIPWAIRALAGLAGWEPFGYAIPKLGFAIGIWLGAYGAALAIATALGTACAYWIAQAIGRVSSDETLPLGGFLSLASIGFLLLAAT
jgi:hypothetical protein